MILLDTSGLLANYDQSDRYHMTVAQTLALPQRRILSPFVLAELDYLIAKIAGQPAELVVMEDVANRAYELASFEATDVGRAKVVIERYADLGLGLADASIVVLAERYGCFDLLSLDQRHFRTLTSSKGDAFRLLPLDSR
ncbi:MAG: PIN domain-containing protein [Chloroflexi bacterium]|nr:PIN domain-containing protein [Chloroflexota bacterium]